MRERTFSKKTRGNEVMDIDITSLLDILVILLVFLLKSYNASNLKLNLVENLDMANSQSRKLGQHAIIIQMDKEDQVWLDNKLIGNFQSVVKTGVLSSEVKKVKKEKDKMVNLIFDKETSFKKVNKIMDSMASIGLGQFRFIVKGNY